jgi:predicted nucleic acid-binding protein
MTSITIRDVPDAARDELAARAARTGRSLQEYLRRELVALAGRPDPDALATRIVERKERTSSGLTAVQILAHRDASTIVAALIDAGHDGRWAEPYLTAEMAAPHLLSVEVANVLRRAAKANEISDDVASLAHADLLDLRVDLVPYADVAIRAWELRHNVSSYDAWYVATAEVLDVPLATLDRRLASAPGPRCEFQTPGR